MDVQAAIATAAVQDAGIVDVARELERREDVEIARRREILIRTEEVERVRATRDGDVVLTWECVGLLDGGPQRAGA